MKTTEERIDEIVTQVKSLVKDFSSSDEWLLKLRLETLVIQAYLEELRKNSIS